MRKLIAFVLVVVAGHFALAQSSNYFNKNGVAIRGYDVVAYFVDQAAVKGIKEFSYSWQGAQWYFKNQGNVNAFKENPEKYAPQFGGYCAFGVSENHKSPTDPSAFTIANDKLYLNYNAEVKTMWVKDIKGNIEKGKNNWVRLKAEK